ncbi:MAG: L,D-transpeptidase [Pseudomonadota bacterium]
MSFSRQLYLSLCTVGLLGSVLALSQPALAEAAKAQSNGDAVSVSKGVKVAAVDGAAVGAAKVAPKAQTQAKPQPKVKKKKRNATLRIAINLSKQRMTVREHGRAIHTWKISSGRAGYRTPTGSWKPQWMTRMHYSRKYDNAPMPHSVFYHRGYAIHATYATGRLGAPASHGCIRLSPTNAKRLYNLVLKHKRANTKITVFGVARDRRPAVAKKKSKRRVARNAKRRSKRAVRRSSRPRATPRAYRAPRRTWPGDAPRRIVRYSY